MQFSIGITVADETKSPRKFTLNDIEVGSRLYEALVRHAQATQGAPIIYGDLLALAKGLHPEDAVLQRAVPIGIGMKLLFVEAFCISHGYPNLACLAVNAKTLSPGPGYKGDWEADKRAVAGFDWSGADAQLATYASEKRSALPKKLARRGEDEAKKIWYAFYKTDKKQFIKLNEDTFFIGRTGERIKFLATDLLEIINLIMDCLEPAAALRQVLDAKAEFGDNP